MAIANVALGETFNAWRIRTNVSIDYLNRLANTDPVSPGDGVSIISANTVKVLSSITMVGDAVTLSANGSNSIPSMAFSEYANTGVYLDASNRRMNVVVDASEIMRFGNTYSQMLKPLRIINGSQSLPGLSFGSDSTSGILNFDGAIGAAVGGNLRLLLKSNGSLLHNSASQFFLGSNTNVGGDTKSTYIGGGGSPQPSRGSYVITHGANYSGNSGVLVLGTGSSGGSVRVFTSGTESFRFTNGRLAIGNTNPAYALQVTGDINYTGELRKNGAVAHVANTYLQTTLGSYTANAYAQTTFVANTYLQTNYVANTYLQTNYVANTYARSAFVANTASAQGEILYFDGDNWQNLAPSTNGYYLQTQGAGQNPIWAVGSNGPTGAQGDKGGLQYAFSITTAMADPGAGIIRFNNATIASVTAIAVDDLTSDATDVSGLVTSWADSTSTLKGYLFLKSNTNGDATNVVFSITGLTDNAGWTEVAVTYVSGALPADAEELAVDFYRTGDIGVAGPPGPPGPTGPGPTGPACSCFLGHELVLMGDGSEKRIDEIRTGDMIACHFNGVAEVFGVRRGTVRGNTMYQINGDLITTGEHAFWSADGKGWLACEASEDTRSNQPWRQIIQGSEHQAAQWHYPPGMTVTEMKIGDRVLVGDTAVTITKIDKVDIPQHLPLFTPVTTSSMIIHNGWVVDGWTIGDFDKPQADDKDRRLKIMRGEIDAYTPWSNIS